jgi:hypothetical protein
MTGRLFHFTCEHSYPHLGARGVLVPQHKPTLFGVRLPDALAVVWLTAGDYASTGMDRSDLAICDRSAYRYVVTDPSACVPWLVSAQREELGTDAELLEAVGIPELWYISAEPVAARLG